MTLKIRILLYLTFITKSNQICTWNLAVFIDLWLCLLTTKLSYSQLFKWGHSNVIRGNFPQILWQRFREFLCNLLRLTIPYEVHQWTENTYKKILWFQFANNWSVLTGLMANEWGKPCYVKWKICSLFVYSELKYYRLNININ